MSLITYNQNASMTIKGLIPAGGAGISVLASPDLQVVGAPMGDYLAETYQIEPLTAATALDLGKITTGKVVWIQTDQPLAVTVIQATFYGSSVSASSPIISIAGGTLAINLNGDGVQIITLALSGDSSGLLIAADIQAKVRALTAFTVSQAVYNNFTATYANGVYTLVSGVGGTSSSVVISGGSDAPSLKLGVANGGTEMVGTPAAVLTLDSFIMANLTFTSLQLANLSATTVADVAIVVLGNRNFPTGSGIY